MYKVINHTITEEHYGHPTMAPMPGVISPLPPSVMTDETMTFRMDSRTLWTRYALGMINFSVSDFGNLASTDNVKNSLARNAAAIGQFFVPYYGFTTGDKITNLLNALIKNGEKIVGIIKSGKTDVAAYVDIWAQQSMALADYLHEINPSNYPKDLLTDMFTTLTKFWLDDFMARYTNDFAADAVALDNILKMGVTGVPDHAKAGYSSIADVLSRGIIAQFPLLFTA